MNDVKIASDLARMSIGVMDTTAQIMQLLRALTLFYVEKMKDDRDRQLLLDFYGAGEKEIKLLREQNKKDGKNNPLTIKSYDINPSNLKILQSICKRDGIAYMINQISTTDLVPDGIGDSVQTGKFTMSVYSTRQQEFEAAIREAKIRSGQELEMDASYLIGPSNLREKDALQRKGIIFIDTQLASENPIKWMKEPIPEDKYVLMRQAIQKLPPEMRSTLIYRKLEDGTRQVGFLSKTEQLFDKKGNRYVEDRKYDATNIMKGVMASVNLQMRSRGIDDKVKIGDLVIGTEYFYHDFDCTEAGYVMGQIPALRDVKFIADKKLVDISYENALKVLPENRIFKGIIATGDIFVAKKEIKDRIKENFDSLCCEMESCSIVHTCHLNNVGYLALRSISDNANEEADCDFETFVLESAKVVKSIILDIIEEI